MLTNSLMKKEKVDFDKLVKEIKENQNDPEFIRAAYEFIRRTTS